ncbi:MAG TPA: ABC transporter substrate-binding protein, partial [Candidatus Limnocylindrales bacterium]|nr:ABC transporter substrate-binding protein [Candidatus Limnocylindrales bacterium]
PNPLADNRMKRVSVLFVLSVLFHLFAAPTTDAQTLKRIKIGYPSLSFRQSNVWVAREMGLFNKYGLEVEPILFRGGQVATQALVSGDPPIVNIGTVVQATIQGHNVVLVAAVETKYDLIIFTRSGITQMEQLRGKRLGITGFNSATHYASIILARHLNADLKEFTLIPAGLDTERIAAVNSGVLDATYVATSAAPLARKAGLQELVQIGDLGVEVQGNGFATSRAYIASNRDTVKSALKGFVEAIYFIYSNKKDAQRVFSKYMRSNDPAVLEDSYNGYIKSIPKKPYPTLKGIQFMLDVLTPTLPQAKNFKPEQFVDLSFLQELEKEGFFNEMAKRYPVK